MLKENVYGVKDHRGGVHEDAAIVLGPDRDDALKMIRDFVKRLEQAMHSGLKSHLDG